jgi:hypothetical protein
LRTRRAGGKGAPRFRCFDTNASRSGRKRRHKLAAVREVDLAVYADALAGESAALAARAERLRSNLRQAKIERRARNDLAPATVERLQALGLLCGTDERKTHVELHELEESLTALEELQAWVEGELAATSVG